MGDMGGDGIPDKATKDKGVLRSELGKSHADSAFNILVYVAVNGSSDISRIAATANQRSIERRS